MLDAIALACMGGALVLLALLAVTDIRTRLLPNEMVLGFATLGVVFHLTTLAAYLSVTEIAAGGLLGFGALYIVRAVANRYYGTDALGLGDVKLIGAAGLWLGPDMVMMALMAGALAGLAHGLGYALWQVRRGEAFSLAHLQIPAGPGFAFGIVVTAGWFFRGFFADVWRTFA
jgi:leader peptidase (prepilin peptidase)/N-methyltransferase